MIKIADIFRKHGSSYINQYSHTMLPSHKKAFADILKCRTPIMGGKVYYCPDCNKYEYSYHSCGNRNCPKCQNDKANLWLEKNSRLLLPVNHFMVTFTIPKELRKLARSNQKLFYSILFKTSSKTMEKLSLDKKYVGGKLGMIAILHTWSKTLVYHPHVHYIVTGGGYSKENNKWNRSRDNFLFPVKVLSKIFKAKFRDELSKTNPTIFNSISADVWYKAWVVNSIPVGKGEKALKYLAQYVFRIAISNNRIISLKNGVVAFKYKDSKTNPSTDGWKIMNLEADEFIRRFLQHVLPSGFVKVRYYGLFASANRDLLSKTKEILGCDNALPKKKPNVGKIFKCPQCKKEMVVAIVIPRPVWKSNKAPPIINRSIYNLDFNQCA
ncbi:MAG: IS91 family transposase [Promethearchaeota archaeon]